MAKRNKIPDRWLNYTPFKDVIAGTCILPLKAPLKDAISSQVPEDQRFTPDELIRRLEEKDLTLGMIVDLTNTFRYVDKERFEELGVLYVKIFTQGHNVPSQDVIRKFSSALESFEETNEGRIVGVHCTHGVNRTGYLICRYLIERHEFTPEKAMTEYAKARGYPIERENYINSLKSLPDDRSKEAKNHDFDHHAAPGAWHQTRWSAHNNFPQGDYFSGTYYHNGSGQQYIGDQLKRHDPYYGQGRMYDHGHGSNSSDWRNRDGNEVQDRDRGYSNSHWSSNDYGDRSRGRNQDRKYVPYGFRGDRNSHRNSQEYYESAGGGDFDGTWERYGRDQQDWSRNTPRVEQMGNYGHYNYDYRTTCTWSASNGSNGR